MNEAVGTLESESRTRSTIGHLKGLYYLALTETCERFSYYGMTSLVVLYMANELLLRGHVETIAGFTGFRAALETVFGPLSTQALASQIFGLFTGSAYFAPVLGGLIADRWIGHRNAVAIGAVLICAGHLAMVFDQAFLLAILLLIVGCGLLKRNIASQVGALYAENDEFRRARGFTIFSMGINIGATLGPIVCGLLALRYGWHVAFGCAAAFMFSGLVIYLSGGRYLTMRTAHKAGETRALTAVEWRRTVTVVAVLAITVFQSIAYFQSFNTISIWIQGHVDLGISGFTIPVPWFNSVDPIFSILGVPALFALWRWQATRGGEPGDLDKIGIGAWMSAGANLVLVLAITVTGGESVSPVWPFLYFAALGVAFLHYWPTTLASMPLS